MRLPTSHNFTLVIIALCVMCTGCRTASPHPEQASLIPSPPIVQGTPATRDRDADGIVDADDACPTDAEDFDGVMDEDGCPEEDADRDGFPDSQDACPVVSETINGFEDRDGCPDEGKALCNDCIAIKRLVLVVYFEQGDDEIKEDELSMVTQLATEIMESESALEVFVVGHTSEWGDAPAQKSLGRARALHIKEELVMLGVEEEAITISSRGARSPRVPHDAKDALYLNDRVEVHVR